MKTVIYTISLILALSFWGIQAQAQDASYLSFGGGYYDFNDDFGAADARLEYRSGHKYFSVIKPWAGVEATSEGSMWGGVGILADIPVTERFYIVPNFGAGLYAQGSSDKDLGHVIEFRSQLEFAYQFSSMDRLGVSVGHISNASLSDDNPGTEILSLYWHMPLQR